jgi:phosphoesterase RecJ-like protein
VAGHLISQQEAAARILGAQRILFFMHVSPDGDSLGSSLALVHALRKIGREAVIVGVDPIPRIYQFLPDWDRWLLPWEQVEGEWDLSCFLDCGDLHRVGAALPAVAKGKLILNIDHHPTNTVFGDENWMDFSAAAVGELAYRLLKEMNLPIGPAEAVSIYTSIVADTGGFRYSSTTAQTHRIAAELLEQGVEPYVVAAEIFENETPGRIALLGRALAGIQIDPSGKLAWITLTQQDFQETGATEPEAEGLVNWARALNGIEVGVLFKETPEGPIRASLRSRFTVDVGQVAKQFGGGGHTRASGCTLEGPLDQAQTQLLTAVRAAL